MSETDWTHPDLVKDLHRCRHETGDIVAQEVSLGSWGGAGYADVASIKPSWTSGVSTIWECKVSRSDFLADVRAEKYRRYLPFCRRLYFAAPAGLLSREEIPDECGLFVRSEKGWSGVKRPQLLPPDAEAEQAFLFALLLNMRPSPWQIPHPDRLERLAMIREGREDARAIGKRAADALYEWERMNDRYQNLQRLLRDYGIEHHYGVNGAVVRLIDERDELRQRLERLGVTL